MKRHYASLRNQQLAILLFLAFAACKKDQPSTPTTPQPPVILPQACKLVEETKDFPGDYEHYWYTYRQDGKLDSIYLATTPGTGYVAYCREDPDGFVWVSYSGSDGVHPSKYDALYTNGILQDSSKFPTTLATSMELWTGTRTENNPGYGYNFQYKSNGKLDGYQQTAPFVTGLLVGLGLEYTPDGDIDNMVWNVTTGPRQSSTVKVTGYDGHPSPYTGIAGWVFLNPSVGWDNSEYDALLWALSPHNPTGSVFDNGTEKWTETYSYEYNTQGLPTKRTIVLTNSNSPGNSSTRYYTYTYSCK